MKSGRVVLLLVITTLTSMLSTAVDVRAEPPRRAPVTTSDPEQMGSLEGSPSRPRAGVDTIRRQAAARGDERRAATAVTGYRLSARDPVHTALGRRPYDSGGVWPRDGYGLVDGQGVRMFSWPGESTLWNHPVGQAQYAIANLESYRNTGDPIYLERGRVNAQRLVDRRVESAGAWFFPYDFDFAPWGDPQDALRAPWYSAMAQGLALSAFVRLSDITGDPAWREAADATFASLSLADDGAAPYVSRVDAAGRLWLEEYPRYPPANGEMVLNGHVFAMYGLYDYWQLSDEPLAAYLFRGALAALEDTAMTSFRRPSWASVYSLRHKVTTSKYHPIHQAQFLMLGRLTGDTSWLAAAATFRTDFPAPLTSGTLRISPKVTKIYRVDSTGRLVKARAVKFNRFTQAPFDRRQRSQSGPIAYRVSAGPYAGWWFVEGFNVAWGLGSLVPQAYAPAVDLRFRGGATFTAYRLDSRGAVAGHKTITLPVGRDSKAPTSASAVVQGRPAYYVTAGSLAGYWVPFQSKVYLR